VEVDATTTVIIRNNRFLVGLVFLLGVVGLVSALCTALVALVTLIPLRGFTLDRVASTLWGLVFAGFLWTAGWTSYRAFFQLVRNEARLDEEGVHFRLGPKKQPQQSFFPWNEVASVTYKRTGNTQRYAVSGRDGRVVAFTAFTFFRPKKLAHEIALRSGLALQRTL
jgi:hypothetical protein